MPGIFTNVNASFAQNALAVNSRAQTTAMQQLSTGVRINSAKDDAAGLAMATTMTSQVRGLNMAVRKANDGISMMQTADGAMIEQTNMLQRMRELAVQAATDTTDSASKGYLDTEFSALKGEINRISSNTSWNGMKILDASNASGVFNFVVSANGGSTGSISVTINKMDTTASLAIAATSVTGSTVITNIDTAINNIASQRASIGAAMNRLSYAADNLSNIAQNTTDSRSRIMDTDYAIATTQLSRTQIISQAATAMLAQANQQQQNVLALLK
jgi:flagellin